MSRRTRYLLLFIASTSLLIAFGYDVQTHVLRGHVCGEAFYDGRPTSWWREVVDRDLQVDPRTYFVSRPAAPPGWWARFVEWTGMSSDDRTSLSLLRNPQSRAVLDELANDADERIAGFSGDVAKNLTQIKLDVVVPDWAHVTMDEYFNQWIVLLDIHHRRPPR